MSRIIAGIAVVVVAVVVFGVGLGGGWVAGCRNSGESSKGTPRTVRFRSNDPRLSEAFDWAKHMALSYAHDADDAVGPWYDAALPNREAFCMRDVAHQGIGAEVLGLHRHSANMLRRFAAAIAESRDWCSYWEINGHNEPAPVDFRDDKNFWYNLPANFDVVSAALRLYQWSGDRTYIDDSVFGQFYERTVNDYPVRWQLTPSTILARPRYMNRDSFDLDDPYQYARGIPSYHEGDQGSTALGADLVAFQVSALRSYAAALDDKDDAARSRSLRQTADSLRAIIDDHFWDSGLGRYRTILRTDGTRSDEGGLLVYLLYNDVVADPARVRSLLSSLEADPPAGIEIRSHLPEVLYRYGENQAAYENLLYLTDPGTARREYPEVSFSVVGAFASGLMGIEPAAGQSRIATRSRVVDADTWVELNSLQVLGNIVDIRHDGLRRTTLVNRSGPEFRWIARFSGVVDSIAVDSKLTAARVTRTLTGDVYSSVEVIVKPGAAVVAEASPPGR